MSVDPNHASTSLQDEGRGEARDNSPFSDISDYYDAVSSSDDEDLGDIYHADEPRQVNRQPDSMDDRYALPSFMQPLPRSNNGEQNALDNSPRPTSYTANPDHGSVHRQYHQLHITTPDESTIPDAETESVSRPDKSKAKTRADSPLPGFMLHNTEMFDEEMFDEEMFDEEIYDEAMFAGAMYDFAMYNGPLVSGPAYIAVATQEIGIQNPAIPDVGSIASAAPVPPTSDVEDNGKAEAEHPTNGTADTDVGQLTRRNEARNYTERLSMRTARASSRTMSAFKSAANDALIFGRAGMVGGPSRFTRWKERNSSVTCNCCMEDQNKSMLIELPCDHYYCRPCFTQLVTNSMANEALFPPACCVHRPCNVQYLAGHFLPPDLLAEYAKKKEEYETAERTYCHVPICSTFLSVKRGHIQAKVGTCPKCGDKTCTRCKANVHEGEECKTNPALDEVVRVGREKKWQRCYNCKRLIESKGGCNHMSEPPSLSNTFKMRSTNNKDCLCGAHFCYACGERFDMCKCENRNNMFGPGGYHGAAVWQPGLIVENYNNAFNVNGAYCGHTRLFQTPGHLDCFICGIRDEVFECPACHRVFCENCSRAVRFLGMRGP